VSSDVVAGWWWVRYSRSLLGATIGAYDASFTPLTLMRWDPADNPLGGGSSCCAVAVGGLRGESLEELTEDYKLEGAKFDLAPGPAKVTLLLARTAPAAEAVRYAQYLAGGRAKLDFFCSWAGRAATVGLSGLRVVDDLGSVRERGTNDPLCSDVAGADFDLPVAGQVALSAEYAYSLRDDNRLTAEPELSGQGLSAGVRVGDREQLDGRLYYVRAEPDFLPLFRAQSVSRNRQGVRFSLTRRAIAVGPTLVSLSAYVKYQREFEPLVGTKFTGGRYPGSFWVATASAGIEPWGDIRLEAQGEWRRNSRADDPETPQADELLNVTEAIGSLLTTYRFTLQNTVQLKYSLVRHAEPDERYLAHIPSLEVSVKF
jgi:hypothetical protein